MHIPQCDYVRPVTIDEITGILAARGDRAKILAGGTDLLVQMKDRLFQPEVLVAITAVEELYGIGFVSGRGLRIGAAVKIESLEESDIIREKYFALHKGAGVIGSTQIRAMATIGGNSCNASPCADTVSPLVAFGARVAIIGKTGTREMHLEDFITGNGATRLEKGEFVEGFYLEGPWPRSGSGYHHMGLRDAMEIDIANVAVNVSVEPEGTIRDIRIALGSVSPSPLRAGKSEVMLTGNVPSRALIEKAAEACAEESRPINDLRASAAYRREVVGVLFKRAFAEAMESINQG